MTTQQHKLYKSNQDKMLDGVCAGIAEYLDIDPNIIRICWIALTLFGGAGILLYIAGIIIIPRNPIQEQSNNPKRDRSAFVGMTFVFIGCLVLFANMNLLDWFDWHISWTYLVPVLLILLGGWILLDFGEKKKQREEVQFNSPDAAEETQTSSMASRLYRSSYDKKILGVCGGMAEYFGIDSSLIRIGWILILFASFGTAIILYFLIGILLPRQEIQHSTIQ